MLKNRALSFKFAFSGIWIALKDQPNLKFHFFAAFIAIILSWLLQITKTEWLVVILIIGLVITVELTNTAIEEVVNSFTAETHPSAKFAKDVSAGAVLTVSIVAFVIGLLIFAPYLSKFTP